MRVRRAGGRPRLPPGPPAVERARARTRAYNRKRLAAAKFVLDCHKIVQGCRKCGYSKLPGVLELHHNNPLLKRYNVTKTNVPRKDFHLELAKCVVLCGNCHTERHLREDEEFP
jgi:hypothetical protein